MSRIPRAPVYPNALALATRLVLEPLMNTTHYSVACWQRGFVGWSDARRAEWQRDQLAHIADHAVRTVAAYRGLPRPSPSDDIGDMLARFPVVTKADIRADLTRYRSSLAAPVIPKGTGGTTGDPFRYPLDRDAWSHMYGTQLRFFEETGYRYGERVAMFGTPASLWNMGWKQRIRHAVEQHDFNHTGLTIDPAISRRRVHDALASGARLWYGYAGTIAAMADAQLAGPGPTRGPRAIVTTAEALQPQWRRSIERAFQVQVHDQFGCNDGGILSQSCGAGRWHLAESLSIAEVLVDGTPVPPGTMGDLVITNLHARALPFIRYHAGDQAALGRGTCPCGRPGATIECLGGRVADRIRLANGTVLSSVAFAALFVPMTDVRRWQVVQTGVKTLTIRVELDRPLDDELVRHMQAYVHDLAGTDIAVRVTQDEPIEATRGGKLRPVIGLPTTTSVRTADLTAV